MPHQLIKYNHDKLTGIIAELELDNELTQELQNMNSDTAILNTLMDHQQLDAAIQFLTFGLPKRESIWWAYLCAYDAESESNDSQTQTTLKTIEQWVKTPTEELRYQAYHLAQALDLQTPASWTAMGIFWSGGSIAPKDKPAVEADYFMSGYAVSNGITIAADHNQSPQDHLKFYLRQGLHIAVGGNGKIASM